MRKKINREELLEAIKKYIAVHGYPPTNRECNSGSGDEVAGGIGWMK